MASRRFEVYVARCEESGVFYIKESDIWGLHLEAPSFDVMGDEINEFAPLLIRKNHPLPAEEASGDAVVEVYLVPEEIAESDSQQEHHRPTTRVLMERQGASL